MKSVMYTQARRDMCPVDAEIAADWPQSQTGQGRRRLADQLISFRERRRTSQLLDPVVGAD